MKTNEIRRVIDASLGGLKLSPEERRALAERSMRAESAAPTPARGGTRLARRLLLAAAIALLTLSLIVPAVGGGLRRTTVTDRREDLVIRYDPEAELAAPEGVEIPEVIGEIWGEVFREGLIEANAMVMLPRWVPEGYELSECDYLAEFGQAYSSLSRADGEQITLQVHVWQEGISGSTAFYQESEEGSIEEWVYEGVSYYYSTNYSRCSVTWVENNCVVSLGGPRDRETMRRIIESIYDGTKEGS